MIHLAFHNLYRRPLRTGLTVAALSLAVAVLGCLSAFGDGYRAGLYAELNQMGMQMMLVPLGCPYDAAARVIKGRGLDNALPMSALNIARRDPAVAVAAPLLMAAVPRPDEGRTDLWVGMDRSAIQLKPWWRMQSGSSWFTGPDSVILGAEAAAVEMRVPGDKLYSPETGRTFTVAGILKRSGVSDDSLFFVPLQTAQEMFHQTGLLTAVAIRLKDPMLLREAADRLQSIRGAQVVTLTEMRGTFLNLVGSVEALLMAIALVAIAASALIVFNTLLGNVLEQLGELAVMRALGASRVQIYALVIQEAVLLTLLGSLVGLVLAGIAGHLFDGAIRGALPLPPDGSLLSLSPSVIGRCMGIGVGVGILGCLYPAWVAGRVAPAEATRASR